MLEDNLAIVSGLNNVEDDISLTLGELWVGVGSLLAEHSHSFYAVMEQVATSDI